MLRRSMWVVASLLLAVAARAQQPDSEPVAPAALSDAPSAELQFLANGFVGLVPPPGMVMRDGGFWPEDRSGDAYIYVGAQPDRSPDALAESARLEAESYTEDDLADWVGGGLEHRERSSPTRFLVAGTMVFTSGLQGEERAVEIDRTTLLIHEAGLAVTVEARIARDAADRFPPESIRESLASVVVRAPISREDKVAAIRDVPPLAPHMRAVEVDHVVEMTSAEQDRIVVARSGPWLHEERVRADGERSTLYSSVDTGVSMGISYQEDGRLQSLYASRLSGDGAQDYELDSDYRAFGYRRVVTDVSDTLLGETCTIWRDELDDPSPRDMPVVEGCTTSDGVELWRRTIMPNGELQDDRRATSVERRPVGEEAQPLLALLDPASWRDGVPTTDDASNDEVLLQAPGYGRIIIPGVPGEITIRRRAGLTYRNEADNLIRLEDGRDGLTFSYELEADGRLKTLEISSFEPSGANDESLGQAPETVAGETCEWRRYVGSGNFAAECRTSDGLVLKLSRSLGARHGVATWTAARLRRNSVTEADVAPPAEALDWFR